MRPSTAYLPAGSAVQATSPAPSLEPPGQNLATTRDETPRYQNLGIAARQLRVRACVVVLIAAVLRLNHVKPLPTKPHLVTRHYRDTLMVLMVLVSQ